MEHLDAFLNAKLAGLGWPLEAVVKLALAAVAGALVGLEREVRGRQAGFRTNLLVCVGSALVMIVSARVALIDWPEPPGGQQIRVDPSRIAYGVMGGIGFLGAGVIVRTGTNVRGLTTAAGMWCVAAIGLSAGLGLYLLTACATLIVLLALWLLDYVGKMLPSTHYRNVTVRRRWEAGCIDATVARLKRVGLRVTNMDFRRTPDLADVDIDARVSFTSSKMLYSLERELAGDDTYLLLGLREV